MEQIDAARHPLMIVYMEFDTELNEYDILRKKSK